MDNIRGLLWFVFALMLWLNYAAWMSDYAPPPPPADGPVETDAPEATLPPLSDPAAVATRDDPPSAPQGPDAPVRVRTDVLDIVIDTTGGDLVRADLPAYPVDKDNPDNPVRLLDFTPGNRWVFQTGLRQLADGPEPNHLAAYRSARSEYVLPAGQDELRVTLEWEGPEPLTARKIYTFRRGSYGVDLTLQLRNGSTEPWRGAPYAQISRYFQPVERSFLSVDSYSFRGPVLYNGDQYEKLDFNDIAEEPVTQTVTGGWAASIQHHFLSAFAPPPAEAVSYQAATRGQDYILTGLAEVRQVEPGATLEYPLRLFVGPKLQEQLTATAEGLELTVDYGVLTMLAQPLFWLLSLVHDWVGNWGWSIIIVTLLIKLAFYKLTETSGRSMAKMRKLAPRMKALQERFKDDRQALSQAMMEMYKREKVNPAAGCLPILVQMPFFFAFYWVLIESVEMRQAPFMLWIDDLSSRDPYFILPLLMGAAMFFQTRLNPAPPDPIQARIMQIMPLMFTVFFAFFPSGLVLYWLTNTALSILQQWRINKVVAA